MQSFMRWAGSKRLLLPELASYWPRDATRYIEPFAGSACLFFFLEPARAVLGDLNADLIATYKELQRDVDLVLESYRRFPRGKRAYYAIRKRNPKLMSKTEAAARFLYLNRYCFNGLFRTNQTGTFNVPYGPPRRKLTRFEERVREGASLLRRADLRSADFAEVISDVVTDDFVYLDPPYAIRERRRLFSDYLPISFAMNDIHRLANTLDYIESVGAQFLLSYADCREIRHVARRWRWQRVASQRNIAGFVGARKRAPELLVTNIEV